MTASAKSGNPEGYEIGDSRSSANGKFILNPVLCENREPIRDDFQHVSPEYHPYLKIGDEHLVGADPPAGRKNKAVFHKPEPAADGFCALMQVRRYRIADFHETIPSSARGIVIPVDSAHIFKQTNIPTKEGLPIYNMVERFA
jgi:hypothetical protein